MSHLDEGILHALLDGEMPSGEAAEARAHLATCGECRRRLEEARGFLAEADALVGSYEVPSASGRVFPAPARRRIPMRRLALAATIAVAVGTGYLLRGFMPVSRPAAESIASAPEPTSPPTDPRAAALQPAEQNAPAARTADDGKAVAQATRDNAGLGSDAGPGTAGPKESGLVVAPPAATEEKVEVAAKQRAAAPPPQPATGDPALGGVASADRAAPAKRFADEVAPLELRAVPNRARADLETTSDFRPISLEEGVRLLGGSIRLIDGLEVARVETADGGTVPGTQAGAAIVRVVYGNDATRLIVLDQQRVGREARESLFRQGRAGEREQRSEVADADVDRVVWRDQHGFLFVLSGPIAYDSLISLRDRIR